MVLANPTNDAVEPLLYGSPDDTAPTSAIP